MKQVKQAANQPDVEACWGEAGNFSVVLVFVWPARRERWELSRQSEPAVSISVPIHFRFSNGRRAP
jgi:hypothetical protein